MGPDNFTPPTRTPWGGRVIIDELKAGLPLEPSKASYSVVGESWEISVEPNFPSRVVNVTDTPLLSDLIDVDPAAALGERAARELHGCSLLVKLLDAARPLSVQVHPSDDYERLGPRQSGKPESWMIAAAQPNAGIYLGLKSGVDRATLELRLRSGDNLEPLLNFVPVQPGECYEIEPGTIHSIGAGVTLVEPQVVRPGREGVTYRFWDWNRRYAADGSEDPNGRPRPLHIEDSLAVALFDYPTGEDYIASLRRSPVTLFSNGDARHEGLVDNRHFRVERLSGTGRLGLDSDGLVGIVVVAGSLECSTTGGSEAFRRGESFVLPLRALPAEIELVDCLAVVSRPASGLRENV